MLVTDFLCCGQEVPVLSTVFEDRSPALVWTKSPSASELERFMVSVPTCVFTSLQ